MTDLFTRDGTASVAAQIEAHALRVSEAVSVTPRELVQWADANHLNLSDFGQKLPAVNARRTELGLPPFRVVGLKEQVVLERPLLPLIASSEDELDHLVKNSDGTKTGLMTADCARWGLKHNRGNRRRVVSVTNRFVSIIRRGQWLNTSEPIIFSREALNDGQHRLTAIAEVGIPVEVDVRFGIERDAFMQTNTGAKRTASQTLYILGVKNPGQQAAIARLLTLYDRGRLGETGGGVVETSDIVATINATPAVAAAASFMVRSSFAPTRSAPFGFVLAAAARTTSIDRALAFGDAVAAGRASDDDASRSLHIKLRDVRMSGKHLGPVEVAALTVRAWNSWLAGKPVTLRLLKEDLAPGAFPRVQGDADD